MDNSLTLASSSPLPAKVTKASYSATIPYKWKCVVAYHLAGKKPAEIARITGYYPGFVYTILSNPRALAYRQQLMSATSREFEAQFAKVVEVIGDGLADNDPMVRMAAAEKWLKAHGKYQPKQLEQDREITTAEDVVRLILEGDNNNVQVNINAK